MECFEDRSHADGCLRPSCGAATGASMRAAIRSARSGSVGQHYHEFSYVADQDITPRLHHSRLPDYHKVPL